MENNQNQDVTIDNKYLISVLEQENKRTINLFMRIEYLKHISNN